MCPPTQVRPHAHSELAGDREDGAGGQKWLYAALMQMNHRPSRTHAEYACSASAFSSSPAWSSGRARRRSLLQYRMVPNPLRDCVIHREQWNDASPSLR